MKHFLSSEINPQEVNPSEQENLQNASSLLKVCVRITVISHLSPSVSVAFRSDRGMKNGEELLTVSLPHCLWGHLEPADTQALKGRAERRLSGCFSGDARSVMVREDFPSINPIASSCRGIASWCFQTTYRAEFTCHAVLPETRKEADPSRSATPAPMRSRRKDFKAPVPQTIPPGARPRTLGGQLLHTKDPKIIAEFKVPKETQRYQDYPCGRRSPRARYSATIKEWERRPQEMILREPVVLGKVARIDWEARFEKAGK
eukprot:s312_g15.t2